MKNAEENEFKDSKIGKIPLDWEINTLRNLCIFTTGKLNSNQAEPNGKYPFFTCSPETFRINSYSFDCEAVILSGI